MDLANIIYAVILGAIQGITEFLPVSSSAHLIMTSWLFQGKTLSLSMNVALHLGTLTSVLLYFRRDWLNILTGLYRSTLGKGESLKDQTLLWALVVGTIPAGTIGLLWKDEIEHYLHKPSYIIFPLAVVGIALWWVDRKMKPTITIESLSLKQAFLIGVAQACALIPGTSRSGATIMGGRLLGLDRDAAARFSFLLGTPAMLGAALLELKNIIASLYDPVFYVGLASSVIVGFLAIHFLLRFLKRFGFGIFAIYRVIIAAVLIYLLN